jgi:hypothetical protein
MGARNQLILPNGMFESNNCLAIGWFFLFKETDFYVIYDNEFRPKSRCGKIYDEEKYGVPFNQLEEWIDTKPEKVPANAEIGFKTTIRQALINFESRVNMTKVPYLISLFSYMNQLPPILKINPQDETLIMDCIEFATSSGEGAGKMVRTIKKIPTRLELALGKSTYREFYKLSFNLAGNPDFEMTGDLQLDVKNYIDEYLETVESVLLGEYYPK